MTRLMVLVLFVLGALVYSAINWAFGIAVDFVDIFAGIYWSGTALVMHWFLRETA